VREIEDAMLHLCPSDEPAVALRGRASKPVAARPMIIGWNLRRALDNREALSVTLLLASKLVTNSGRPSRAALSR
jgi:hypothetical protein